MKYTDIDRIARFKEILESSSEIVAISHVNPDGDAVGALTATSHFCKEYGLSCTAILPNNYPDNLSFMDADKSIIIFSDNKNIAADRINRADLIIVLDFNNLKRIDKMGDLVSNSSAAKVLIDHHPSPDEELFDLVISTVDVSSTSELLYWVFKCIREDRGMEFSADVAKSLYTGMVTDTNNFSNSTDAGTFTMAADIAGMMIDREAIQKELFNSFSEERIRLVGYSLNDKLMVFREYAAACIVLTKTDLERFNFKEGDSEGLVNVALSIKGIAVSALFIERDDCIRVSLRSNSDFSVNKFSRLYFNGGGHERAAGGKLLLPIDEVAVYFEDRLRDFLTL